MLQMTYVIIKECYINSSPSYFKFAIKVSYNNISPSIVNAQM